MPRRAKPHPRIQEAIKSLVAVAVPGWPWSKGNTIQLREYRGFKLSRTQVKSVRETLIAWENSCALPATLAPDLAQQLVGFLEAKKEIFLQALQHKQALPFDVILLGIVSHFAPRWHEEELRPALLLYAASYRSEDRQTSFGETSLSKVIFRAAYPWLQQPTIEFC